MFNFDTLEKHLKTTIEDYYGWGKGGPRSQGRFGVELELEGRNFADPPKTWVVHQDGSLRNGIEYVLALPLDRPDLETALEHLLLACFKRAGTECVHSYRASTHIHRNVRKETWEDVLGTVITYTVIEPLMLKLCGSDRDGNLFCLPSYDTGDMPNFFHGLLENLGMPREYAHTPQRGKYASLNLNPISRQGSIEFRIFPATWRPKHVLRWADWVDNCFSVAKSQRKDKTFMSLVKEISENEEDFAFSVLTEYGRDAIRDLSRPFGIKGLIGLGVENAYELARVLNRTRNKKINIRERVHKNVDEDGPIAPRLRQLRPNPMLNLAVLPARAARRVVDPEVLERMNDAREVLGIAQINDPPFDDLVELVPNEGNE